LLSWGRADPVVDVAAVGLSRDGDHLGAELAEDRRRGAVGGAVGAVEQDLAAAEIDRKGGAQLAVVVVARVLERPDAADRVAVGVVEAGLNLGLGLVVELVA